MDSQRPNELPVPSPVSAFFSQLKEVAATSQAKLAENPRDPRALTSMALVALASGQNESAVRMAWAATEIEPEMVAAWVVLGQALNADGKREIAEMAYREAIRREGMNPMAHAGLGELLVSSGRAEEAIREYELALRVQPMFVAALIGLGHSLACLQRNEEALECYERALASDPKLPEAEYAAGFVLERMRKVDRAEARYRRALAMRPTFASPWVNLGNLLREQGRDQEAENALKCGVELNPKMISGWINLGLLYRGRRQYEETEKCLRKAFALNPGQVEALIAWCQFRLAERDLAGAWEWLRWAVAADPDHSECENMRGILLHTEGRFPEAIQAFERADAMGHRVACANCGNTLIDQGRVEEALVALEAAAERNPDIPGTLYNLALTRLRLGDWKRGWPAYEARWRFREVHQHPRVFNRPRWQGELLQGQRVLLHAEQGLGDTIQFCRYAELVAARGAVAVLEVQKPVERLMASLKVARRGRAEVALLGDKHPPFDLECPLMSLPAIFGTTVETVSWTGPYLAADPELVRQRLAEFPELTESESRRPLRVGLAWAGNPGYRADHHRSVRLSKLWPLLRVDGAEWFSLQKGPAAEQLKLLPPEVRVHDGSSREADLAETAALLDRLDLVVTTDTCVAHLAGALGKPVWILLPHLADWRWMIGTETTPWYPTARLMRQRAQDDWGELVERVASQLRELIAKRSG